MAHIGYRDNEGYSYCLRHIPDDISLISLYNTQKTEKDIECLYCGKTLIKANINILDIAGQPTEEEMKAYEDVQQGEYSFQALFDFEGNAYCVDCFDEHVDGKSGRIYRLIGTDPDHVTSHPLIRGVSREGEIDYYEDPRDYYPQGLKCSKCHSMLIEPNEENEWNDMEEE